VLSTCVTTFSTQEAAQLYFLSNQFLPNLGDFFKNDLEVNLKGILDSGCVGWPLAGLG